LSRLNFCVPATGSKARN